MSSSVKDRSGEAMLPKSERRALGKIAAQKRARVKRRKQLVNRVVRVTVPFLAVAAVVGLTWWAIDSESPTTTPEASASASSDPNALPPDADPALQTKPVVTAGTDPLTELKVTPLITGTGKTISTGQSITVNYVGVTYATGVEFDASWKSGNPFTFTIGQGQVIDGWDMGLLGQKVGSRVQLDIPANLAYGENPQGGSPAGALRFVVDILSAN